MVRVIKREPASSVRLTHSRVVVAYLRTRFYDLGPEKKFPV